MKNSKTNTDEALNPRFEFRTFGQNFAESIALMEKLSAPVPKEFKERTSEEIYILSNHNNTNNVKIRDGKIDVKTHIKTVEGLEQWKPILKDEFPISKDVIFTNILPALEVNISELNQNTYALNEFIKLVNKTPNIEAVQVKKHRFGYKINNTICEVAYVLINGKKVTTISTESTNLQKVKKTITDCKLEAFENINYLKAIKRTIGWINKSLAN